MKTILRKIDGVNLIDAEQLWKEIEGTPVNNRLRDIFKLTGVETFDAAGSFVKTPQIGIVGIGGLPLTLSTKKSNSILEIRNKSDLKRITESMKKMVAFSGYNSYLNPKDKEPEDFIKLLLNNGHYSTTHSLTLNIMILGVSTAVENEFNCQRDLMHISRLTVSRTKAQVTPPICLLFPELLDLGEEILLNSKNLIQKIQTSQKKISDDYLEATNVLYPAAKATMFTITASVRNLLRLVDFLNDQGKEEEMKRVLYILNNSLNSMFPEIFPRSSTYKYTPPKHLNI